MTSHEEQINNAQVVIEHSHVVEPRSTAAVTLAFERQLSRLDVRLHKMRYKHAGICDDDTTTRRQTSFSDNRIV